MDFHGSLQPMIFGKDLMIFFMDYNGVHWLPKGELGQSCFKFNNMPFRKSIYRAIAYLAEEKEELIQNCTTQLYIQGVLNVASFKNYVMHAIPKYFPCGYTTVHFLAFCTMMCGVAYKYYEMNLDDFWFYPETIAYCIGLVLTGHMMTSEFNECGGWCSLNIISDAIICVIIEWSESNRDRLT